MARRKPSSQVEHVLNGVSRFLEAVLDSFGGLLGWWKQPRLVTWFLFTVTTFVLLRIPFMWIQVIPSHVRFNPAIALVPVAGVFFGPAGACGVFVGTLIGDVLVGQWGMLSLFRGFGVLFFALGTQRLWDADFGHEGGARTPNDSWMGVLRFILVAWPGCFVDAAWRAFGSELLRHYPFVYIISIVVLLNLLFCTLLGAPLYRLMASKWAPHFGTWHDFDRGRHGDNGSILSAFMVFAAGIAACLTGLFASHTFYNLGPFHPFVLGTSTGWLVPFVVVPFLIVQAVAVLRVD